MSTRGRMTDMLGGAAAGLAGSAATAVSNAVLERLTGAPPPSKRSGHEVVAERIARVIARGEPGPMARAVAGVAFAAAFGLGWGLVYEVVSRRAPSVSRLGGLAFALPFFALCDGAIAPLLGVGPSLTRVPWPLQAKELANHVVWTSATGLARRIMGR